MSFKIYASTEVKVVCFDCEVELKESRNGIVVDGIPLTLNYTDEYSDGIWSWSDDLCEHRIPNSTGSLIFKVSTTSKVQGYGYSLLYYFDDYVFMKVMYGSNISFGNSRVYSSAFVPITQTDPYARLIPNYKDSAKRYVQFKVYTS